MEPKVPLTVVIIARDEADRIADAIASAAFAKEVVVLESGSSDDTREVAQSAGARVVHGEWLGFAAQKQQAAELARTSWVFSLDADERIPVALARELVQAVEAPGDRVAFSVPRRTWWQGAAIRHGAWTPDRRFRLFLREHGRWSGADPHDHWEPDGPSGALQTPLEHHAYRSLAEHLATVARYAELQADGLVRAGRLARWWDWLLRPLIHLWKALVWKRGLLDGPRGVAVAFVGAAHVALKWGLVALRQSEGPQ